MRRKEKEIHDRSQIDQVIRQAQVCRLGLCKDNLPYVVPVSFGYDGSAIYIHTASEGKKISYIAANPFICFEFDEGVEMRLDAGAACKNSVMYYSVIGWGTIGELVDPAEKEGGLNQIMQHYTGRSWTYDPAQVQSTRVWRIAIETISGKASGKPAAT